MSRNRLQGRPRHAQITFDGTRAKWNPELKEPAYKIHGLYAAVKYGIGDACEFCIRAFGIKGNATACGVDSAGEHDQYPSFKQPVAQRHQAFTL